LSAYEIDGGVPSPLQYSPRSPRTTDPLLEVAPSPRYSVADPERERGKNRFQALLKYAFGGWSSQISNDPSTDTASVNTRSSSFAAEPADLDMELGVMPTSSGSPSGMQARSGNMWVNPSLKLTTSYVNLQSSTTEEAAANVQPTVSTTQSPGGIKNLFNLTVNTNELASDVNGAGHSVPGSTVSNASIIRPLQLTRQLSHGAAIETTRQTLAEMTSQIRKYDPYPCMLGIPIMPAIFATSKIYIFFAFLLIGAHTMSATLNLIL
jgi:hypothetical protein